MYHKRKLSNGTTLITVPVKGTRAVTVLAMFPVGSRYETPHLSGASHFVEHMLFKGTKKRPTLQDITREVDAAGADYNAFTYKDYTGYYIKIDVAKQDIAFDIIADMLFNSVISKEEVEKEKGAIVEELRMYQDNPSMAIDLLSDRLVFGANALGRDIGGTAETVRGLSQSDLWQYYQRHYSAKNLVLVVAGNINNRGIKKVLRYFAPHNAPKQATTPNFYKSNFENFRWPSGVLPLDKRIAVEERAVDQSQLIINFPGLKNNHPDRYALAILLNILGGGMSSRLFIEVREKRGLAYSVRAGSSSFRDTGLCYVQAGLDSARLGEAATVIKDELRRIATADVSTTELRNAKSNMTGRLALSMEDSSAQAEWYAKQFFFNPTIHTPEYITKKIKAVTAAQVKKIARTLFVWNQARIAVIGPLDKNKVLKQLL